MKVIQVSEFIEVVNGILRETLSGELFAVEGEISGYRVSQGQWVTFDLKDDKALVNVFMPVWNLNVPVEDGMKIRVFGLPRIYPKFGKFSISAERIELAGEGALKKALALLRLRLEKEGLFDEARKRVLPRFPQRIALVASRDSAAYGDFVRILNERWGGLEIDLYHVLVQGEKAPNEIVAAIEQANSISSERSFDSSRRTASAHDDSYYDALVMTRGGGSLEELMAFNDERVVRAIHASRIPTMVAIGHERDITLAEEAADVRGSTPTDCARRLVPDRKDVLYELATLLQGVETSIVQELDQGQIALERAFASPGLWLAGRKAELEAATGNISTTMDSWLMDLSGELVNQMRLLQSLDPKGVLKRGYAILRDGKGHSLVSAAKLAVGQEVSIVLNDGEAGAEITRTRERIQQPKLL
ncbi:exodeoxyribonuclease VII large subunit [Candidatus Uhrbacteria bacterium]|nr:exodeoxyribonuclease VII large subunit [Candidatus Uhrbacteria bacterium]